MRPVKIGRGEGGRVRVTEGLSAGDTIIVQGHYRVQEGTLVADPKADPPNNRTARAETAPGARSGTASP